MTVEEIKRANDCSEKLYVVMIIKLKKFPLICGLYLTKIILNLQLDLTME